jgi:hypothetical protein
VSDTLAPNFDAIWRAQTEDAVVRLAGQLDTEPGTWLARLWQDPETGLELARAVAERRGWHSLHPLVETVLDRVTAAVRAVRDGQEAGVDQGDLALLRHWSVEEGFWAHTLTAAGFVDDLETLLAPRYQRDDLMVAASLTRSPALARLLAGETLQAIVSDPALLAHLGLIIEIEPTFADEEPNPDGGTPLGPEFPTGSLARDTARELLSGRGGLCGLLVVPNSIPSPVHLLGEAARVVVVRGDAAAGAVTRLFGRGDTTRVGDLTALTHRVDGRTAARLLYGSDPGRHLDVLGYEVVAVAESGVSELETLVATVRAIAQPGRHLLRLHPRKPTDIEAVSYRWAGLTTKRPPVRVESLRSEAASAGIDLDLWTVARVGQDPAQAYADIVEGVGERRGWRPIPREVLDTATSVFSGVVAALAGRVTVPGADLARLASWAERPGFWAKLANAGLRTEDGIIFPFPGAASELLEAAVDCQGDPEKMTARLGPLKMLAVRQLGPEGGLP